jgi:predicted permease
VALLSELAAIVLPVFICAGVGLLWARWNMPFDSELVSRLVYKIGVPCLVLATFARVKLDPAVVGQLAAAVFAAYCCFAAIGALVLRAARLPLTSYLPAMMFPLVGSMGLPVALFGFGQPGLAMALVYFTLGSIGTFTVGAAIAAGQVSLAKLTREPVIYAALIVVALLVFDLHLPRWVVNTTGLLGGVVVPLQLIALGCSLGGLRVGSLPRAAALACLRLGMGLVVGYAMAAAFGLTGVARAIIILQSAMPVAVSNYLFALIYKRKPEEVAGMVLISTAIAFLGLPVLLAFLLPGTR